MSKEIKFGVEGRNAMLVGVNTLADAVQVSLHTTIYDSEQVTF
jgi:chaperonin GroEL (HSP60 family)